MRYYDHDMNGWGYGLMTVMMLIFLGLIVFGVVVAVRYIGRAPHTPAPPPEQAVPQRPTPEHLLAERFARGEIDAEEYRHRLDTLRSGPDPTKG